MPSSTTRPCQAQTPRPAWADHERHRTCCFCSENVEDIDFANVAALRRMMTEKGEIRSRRATGTCRRHQNQVGVAVKRAREMALLPLVNS